MRVHPHPVMEGIAYAVGLGALLVSRGWGMVVGGVWVWTVTLWLTGGAAMGALVGAKVLAWVEGPGGRVRPTMDNFLTGGRRLLEGWRADGRGRRGRSFFWG